MHNLPLNQQLHIIGQRANTRQINRNDRYLEVYPELLSGIQALLPRNRQNILLAAHAVFGWMPTQLRVDMGQLNAATAITIKILQSGASITSQDLAFLASTFQTANGNSVVAASKILHFLAPDQFPIWDSRVAKTWGLPPSGPQAANNYLSFVQACDQWTAHTTGQLACNNLLLHLARVGYGYPMTNMRLIELIFFLPP